MKMKVCKYCKESIFEEATKCPKCQAFQNKFFGPNYMGLFLLLLIPLTVAPMFFPNRHKRAKFIDYKKEVSMDVIKTDTLRKEDCNNCDLLNILVELNNNTDIEWEQGEFEIAFKTKEGELLNIEKQSDFRLKLHPNSSAKAGIKIPIYKEYKNSEVEVKLVSLRQAWD